MRFFLTLSLFCALLTPVKAADFSGDFSETPNRTWIGPDYWANRLQDWRVQQGWLSCVTDLPKLGMRTLHLLTHRIDEPGNFSMTTRAQMFTEGPTAEVLTGFLIGAGGQGVDYRSAALVQAEPGPGGGLFIGMDGRGRALIRDNTRAQKGLAAISKDALPSNMDVVLTVQATLEGEKYRLAVTARPANAEDGGVTAETLVPAQRIVGNLALACRTGTNGGAPFRYAYWRITGEGITAHPGEGFGPIAGSQYTLSRGVLKLTAQLTPVSDEELQPAELQIQRDDTWSTIATAPVEKNGYVARFRIADWNATQNTPYRVVWNGGEWAGLIRRDPVDKDPLVVAGFTGNHNNAHGFGQPGYDFARNVYFPHHDLTRRVAMHAPELLFFSGDQIYESASPTSVDRVNLSLDYLYKWYLWCWAYRDLCRDIPCVTLPDDHDVYQGNVWGQGGRKAPRGANSGGYVWPASFVKMVELTQTSHLPDPLDPTPIEQGIGVYYAPLVYGRVGFAIIEDRKFKSGCDAPGMPNAEVRGTERTDHYARPLSNPSILDLPGLTLLGNRQLAFLRDFAADWRGQDMKMCLSQTVFAGLATHSHGAWLAADLDSNGWPQAGRNKAVDALRRGFMLHLSGDQHLATLAHHGIVKHGDANWSMCVPSICNFYPRAWAPELGPDEPYSLPAVEDYTGPRNDGFGNLVTMYAASNPGRDMGHEPSNLHDGMAGYGIVRVNKAEATFTVECWPRYAVPGRDAQYEGWPRTIPMESNYGREAAGWLPELNVTGMENPVVQVIDERSLEVLYSLRIRGASFRPKVFDLEGTYTVVVGEQEPERLKQFTGLTASLDEEVDPLRVKF